jgi:hypothetical protein
MNKKEINYVNINPQEAKILYIFFISLFGHHNIIFGLKISLSCLYQGRRRLSTFDLR